MRTPTNVFYTLVAFAFMWKVSLAYPPYGDVEIVNGKCKWQNYLVPDGESLNLENPCQTWQCNVEDRSFAVLGCDLIGNPYNCEIVRRTGTNQLTRLYRNLIDRTGTNPNVTRTALITRYGNVTLPGKTLKKLYFLI
uniref:Single domain-containing protein n=1 Tax=Ixodes ricinus TaxID=34613 RepID=V5H1C3_IXORI